MSQPNHVPKFGNWDANEQTPFTIAFEKARADHKGGTGGDKMMIPNDPFQNPAAFSLKSTKALRLSRRTSQQCNTDKSYKRADIEKPWRNLKGDAVRFPMLDHAKKVSSGGGKHDNKESSPGGVHHSEQSSSHPSSSLRYHPGNRSAVLAYLGPESKGACQGSAPPHHPPSEKRHLYPASQADSMFPRRGVPLPKFGVWDEKDPTAGDVFTLIFGNARKEKIIGGPLCLPTHQSEISVQEDIEDVYEPPPQSLQQKVMRWLCFARS